jgi:hypothetical protein
MAETCFYRAKKEKNYTVLDNTCLRDKSISWKARGIMAYLLSLPEDWEIHFSEVEKHATDGRDALMSGVKELKKHGYIVVTKERKKDGTFDKFRYNIIENPAHPQTDFPYTDKPEVVKPIMDNPQLLNTDINQLLNIQNTDDNSDSENRTAEKKSKPKKNSKQSLREREPENDYEKVEKAYLEEWDALYGEGKLSEKEPAPSTWIPCRKLMKGLFKTYSTEQLIRVVEKASLDSWLIKNGFNLKTILSGSVLNKLLNTDAETPPFMQPCKHDAWDDMDSAERTAYLEEKRKADEKALEETCNNLPF